MFQYFNKLIEQNHEICLNDPLKHKNIIINYWSVLADFILFIISWVFLSFNYRKLKPIKILAEKSGVLRLLRIILATLGWIYIAIRYEQNGVPFGRFLIYQTRFLTENFFMYFTLYYTIISICDYFEKPKSSRLLNLFLTSNMFGTILVVFGFWLVAAPLAYYANFKDSHIDIDSWKWLDLLTHLPGAFIVFIEYYLIEKKYLISFNYSTLFLVFMFLSAYSILLYFFQFYEFICWIPYDGLLTSWKLKFFGITFVSMLFFVTRKIIHLFNKPLNTFKH